MEASAFGDALSPAGSGWQLEGHGQPWPKMNGHPEGATPWTESGLQALRAYSFRQDRAAVAARSEFGKEVVLFPQCDAFPSRIRTPKETFIRDCDSMQSRSQSARVGLEPKLRQRFC